MDGRDFSIRLKKIKAEVLAMKQAHDYGLSRTDFSFARADASVSSSTFKIRFTLTITFDTQLNNEPFYVWSNDVDTIISRVWDSDTKTTTIVGTDYVYIGPTYFITAISASLIKSMTLEVVDI